MNPIRQDMSTDDVDELIHKWIFSERDRRVMHRRLIDGIPIEKLAAEFDISVSQIKRIVNKGKQTILSHCR